MANDAALPAVIEALTRSDVDPRFLKGVAATINDAATELARDNARAKQVDFERTAKALEAALKAHGVWNVLAIFPDMLRDLGANDTEIEDGSEAERDYRFAADMVESVLPATDLAYGHAERSSATRRKQALAKVVKNIDEVKSWR